MTCIRPTADGSPRLTASAGRALPGVATDPDLLVLTELPGQDDLALTELPGQDDLALTELPGQDDLALTELPGSAGGQPAERLQAAHRGARERARWLLGRAHAGWRAGGPGAGWLRSTPRPRLVWPRMPWPLEIAACVLGNALYEAVSALVQASPEAAFRHARQIERLEPDALRSLEHGLNLGLSAHPLLAEAAGYYYTTLHLTVAATTLVWLWLRHPAVYARARTALAVVTVSALVVFWIYPVAPPRLSVPGAVDTLVRQHIFGAQDGSNAHGLVNLYAAMPSLHVAWAAWCAWAVASALRSRWRLLTWVYPALTTLVVLATANHYVLDVVAGLATVAVVAVLVVTLAPGSSPGAPAARSREPEPADAR